MYFLLLKYFIARIYKLKIKYIKTTFEKWRQFMSIYFKRNPALDFILSNVSHSHTNKHKQDGHIFWYQLPGRVRCSSAAALNHETGTSRMNHGLCRMRDSQIYFLPTETF